MNKLITEKLIEFGLSEKEAKIYLSLLELDSATVFETAKHSDVNRSSAYVVLENLKEKGLVGISDDLKVRKYLPASPETLLHSARNKAKKQEEIKSNIEAILPELKALHKSNKRRPKVRVFEGETGVKEVYADLFTTPFKEIRTYSNPFNIFTRTPDFAQWFDAERGKRGIKIFLINPGTQEVLNSYKHAKPTKPYEAAVIPEKDFKFSTDLAIYGDRVAFASTQDNFGIIIENKEIAETLKNSFDLSWKEAKRLSKKYDKYL